MYGKTALQNLLVNILCEQGETTRNAQVRVSTLLNKAMVGCVRSNYDILYFKVALCDFYESLGQIVNYIRRRECRIAS